MKSIVTKIAIILVISRWTPDELKNVRISSKEKRNEEEWTRNGRDEKKTPYLMNWKLDFKGVSRWFVNVLSEMPEKVVWEKSLNELRWILLVRIEWFHRFWKLNYELLTLSVPSVFIIRRRRVACSHLCGRLSPSLSRARKSSRKVYFGPLRSVVSASRSKWDDKLMRETFFLKMRIREKAQ